jgi:hypothetical protein
MKMMMLIDKQAWGHMESAAVTGMADAYANEQSTVDKGARKP